LIAGSRGVSLATFLRIAKALDVGLDELSAEALSLSAKPGGKAAKPPKDSGPGKTRKRKVTLEWKDFDRVEIRGNEAGETLLIEVRKTKKPI
jgi:hypothetical protein